MYKIICKKEKTLEDGCNELFSEVIKYYKRKNSIIFKDDLMLYFRENALIIILKK